MPKAILHYRAEPSDVAAVVACGRLAAPIRTTSVFADTTCARCWRRADRRRSSFERLLVDEATTNLVERCGYDPAAALVAVDRLVHDQPERRPFWAKVRGVVARSAARVAAMSPGA